MVLKFREIPVGTIDFALNDTKSVKIPRVNAIRTIWLRFFVETVETNVADPTEIEDTILKIIKKIRLVFDADENKFNVDARKLFYVEKFEKGTEPPTNKDDNQAINSTKLWFVNLQMDFATNRLDETDISALLPARKFSKLDLEIDWGDKDDMFSANVANLTVTVANSGCEVEIREVIDTENKVSFAKGQQGKGFIDIRESTFQVTNDKQYTNFDDDALESDIKPAPVTILKHLIIADNDGVTDNSAVITDLAVIDTRGAGETILKKDWLMFVREMKSEYQLESLDDGIVLIDWIDKLGGGLQNIDTEGALKFKFKTAVPSGTDTIQGFTRYIAGRTKALAANV